MNFFELTFILDASKWSDGRGFWNLFKLFIFSEQAHTVHHEVIELDSQVDIKVRNVVCFQWYDVLLDEKQREQTIVCPNLHSKFKP